MADREYVLVCLYITISYILKLHNIDILEISELFILREYRIISKTLMALPDGEKEQLTEPAYPRHKHLCPINHD